MVQNSSRPRGRPRSFDPDAALEHALQTFWQRGYAATSLDDLAAAMGMNRPSIYAAFGDKRALYLKALDLYVRRNRQVLGATLAIRPLRDSLRETVKALFGLYFAEASAARGCFVIGTALTEAVDEPEVRQALDAALQELQDGLIRRFRRAQADGEPTLAAPPELLGRMAADMVNTVAIRARSGRTQADLMTGAEETIDLLCGGPAFTPR